MYPSAVDRLLILAPEAEGAALASSAQQQGLPSVETVCSLEGCLAWLAHSTPVALLWQVDHTTLPNRSILTEALEQLRRAAPAMPLLVQLDTATPEERIAVLDGGADDVISSSCNPGELWARLRVWRRRSRLAGGDRAADLLCHRDLQVGIKSRTVLRAGKPLKLTVKEFDLLLYLLRHKQQVMPRLEILKAVWGETWVGDDNLLDVYVRYLRRKVERPDLEPLIHTVRGVGFVLR